MANILALDVGFVATGWAILNNNKILHCGCIRTKPIKRKCGIRVADDDMRRCAEIARGLIKIIAKYDVRGIVAEIPSGGAQGARAGLLMGKGPAILAALAEVYGLPIECVTPNAVKMVTGHAGASKGQVEAVVIRRWPDVSYPTIKAEREHIMDALGAYVSAENGVLVRTLLNSQ